MITKRVVRVLAELGGQYATRQTVARKLKVKRSTVNSAFQSLERSGKIVASPFVSYPGKRGRPVKAYKIAGECNE